MTTKLPVEIEDIQSWPEEFRDEAFKHKTLLISYHQEYRRISRLGEEVLIARVYPPLNEFEEEYRALADRLETILSERRIVGYHCTRLTASEIKAIKNRGLNILSKELVQQRLDNALIDGLLTEEEALYLRNSDNLKETLDDKYGGRTGMIWFCPNRSSLQYESGVYRLFRSWGGEAIYWGHERDDNIAHAIRRLGKPCIVKCALPFCVAGHFSERLSDRFLSYVVSDAIEYPEPSVRFDMCSKQNLAATDILEIIEITDPEFEQLTGYKSWTTKTILEQAALAIDLWIISHF